MPSSQMRGLGRMISEDTTHILRLLSFIREHFIEYLAAVRNVHLNYIVRSSKLGYGVAHDRAFLARCTQLRKLTITIPNVQLSCESEAPERHGRYRSLEPEEIVSRYMLAPLLQHAPLRMIIVRLRTRYALQDVLRLHGSRMIKVAKLLQQTFRNIHDKKLDVQAILERQDRLQVKLDVLKLRDETYRPVQDDEGKDEESQPGQQSVVLYCLGC